MPSLEPSRIAYFGTLFARLGLSGRGTALLASLATTASLALATQATADPVAQFYQGKTLRVIIGYSAGGGYDLYGRVFAEHFGKFLPGKPTVVPQNMPGAGSFVAAKYLYGVAPKDGTFFGSVSQTLPLDAAMQASSDFDIAQMPYVGRLIDNVDLGLGMSWAPFETVEDVRKREIVVGATGGASPGFLVPAALLAHGGLKLKIVSGYGGSNAVLLALERKEVDLVGSIGMPGILQRNPEWITQGKAKVLYQVAIKPHPLLPKTPTLPTLGVDEVGKQVLTAIAASSDIGRAIITTPGVPPERLAALRKAFQAMVTSPEFIALMKERKVLLGPAPGEELDAIARAVVTTPRPVLDRIQALVNSGKK